jgi:hypothetical protein
VPTEAQELALRAPLPDNGAGRRRGSRFLPRSTDAVDRRCPRRGLPVGEPSPGPISAIVKP